MANLISIQIQHLSEDTIVTIEDAKKHCNVDTNVFDGQFIGWIKSATSVLELFTGWVFKPSNCKAIYAQHGVDDGFYPSFSNGMVLNVGSPYSFTDEYISTNDKRVVLEYTAGGTETWMVQAVLMYVADLYINRGEGIVYSSGVSTGQHQAIGALARECCTPYVNGGIFV